MGALDYIVRSGRALYVGISTYDPEQTRQAAAILRDLGTPCLIHQPRYNMFDRWIEDGLLDVLAEEGIGCIGFSPLCQGILTDKYLKTIPEESRAGKYPRRPSLGRQRQSGSHKPGCQAKSDRCNARAVDGSNGHRLGVAPSGHDVSINWREPGWPHRGSGSRAGQPGFFGCRSCKKLRRS